MRVTVCEIPNNWTQTDAHWYKTIQHLEKDRSDLLVLPEMPFFDWITRSDDVDPNLWRQSVAAHNHWISRLGELPVEMVIASRPVVKNNLFLNNGFIFTQEKGVIPVHDKYYLPDEPGYFEASWYQRGDQNFNIMTVNGLNIGFLICTELWFTAKARDYVSQDIDILVCPRATPKTEIDIWKTGGRAAAIVSGAFCLSSNYNGPNTLKEDFGGMGWIIEPERGAVMGITSAHREMLTLEIDLQQARKAKSSYPRYVKE